MTNYMFDTDGVPIVTTHDSEIIKELSKRVDQLECSLERTYDQLDQLEYDLERTNKQLFELTENYDELVKLVKSA